jgi:hypothetical protein
VASYDCVVQKVPGILTVLQFILLAAFIGGLILAVFAMLTGVDRMRKNRSRMPSPFFNLPAVAAFSSGFGAVGYILASHTRLPIWAVILIAIGGGAIAISAMITLLARWALRGVTTSSLNEDDDIQGQLAIVTREIPLAGDGEITYEHLGRRIRLPARALSTKLLPADADVVIDRIENGVAYVEDWAVVEQRL